MHYLFSFLQFRGGNAVIPTGFCLRCSGSSLLRGFRWKEDSNLDLCKCWRNRIMQSMIQQPLANLESRYPRHVKNIQSHPIKNDIARFLHSFLPFQTAFLSRCSAQVAQAGCAPTSEGLVAQQTWTRKTGV